MRYLSNGGWPPLAEFTEVETGKGANALDRRPQLQAALAFARKHKATLIIAKLDRLARNVAFISELMEAKVDFIAVDNPHATRLTLHILAAVAEHERDMISQRTKAAARRRQGARAGAGGEWAHPGGSEQGRGADAAADRRGPERRWRPLAWRRVLASWERATGLGAGRSLSRIYTIMVRLDFTP